PAEKSFLTALESILRHQIADNDTSNALKLKFLKKPKFEEIAGITEDIPFSSDRKYSGIRTKDAEYLLGATDFLTKDQKIIKKIKNYAENCRVLSVFKNQEYLGCVRLEDEIRKNAPEIVNYFYDNDIEPKIISGDDLETVQSIAETVGIKDLRGIDLSSVKTPNYNKLIKDYAIFTRVKPAQKKQLVEALKKAGRTVAMTGDGVNDILAMKEADCSIAIGEGSDAARRSAKLVLLDSDFAKVPPIIDEGRQSINNLERSTSLFLAKTVYATILAVLFVILPLSYPFSPIEMSLLSFACIGFPGLALALEHNTQRIKDKFAYNIKHYSVPTGLTVAASMVILAIVATTNNFDRSKLTTLSAIIVFAIDCILIYQISKPLNLYRALLLILIIAIFLAVLFIPFLRQFFEFTLTF
ncbi:HAD-IC family P-type ATPase, partial [Candidatus Saccharibacteria bacterium]|nr:HAD-IC family P-type ATPase [Candidatus Saccharibacteria bacterium]